MPTQLATTIPLYAGQAAAELARETLAPYCERIEVAGSIRRQRETVHDIEIVAISATTETTPPGEMFPRSVPTLLDFTDRIKAGEVENFDHAPDAHGGPKWGKKYRTLAVRHGRRRIKIDLFIVQRETWGPQLAIRTGSTDFAKRLMIKRVDGGAMPARHRVRDGFIQLCYYDDHGHEQWRSLDCPEEALFFELIGVPCVEPDRRSETNLRGYLSAHEYRPPATEPVPLTP